MHQKENLHSSSRFRIGPDRSKRALVRTNKELPSSNFLKDKSMRVITDIERHPYEKFIFGTVPSAEEIKKFTTMFYQGLLYSFCSLKGPSEEFLRKRIVRLHEPKQSKKKFLMLDLDQTLIHAVWGSEKGQILIEKGEDTIKFNIRPHCLAFLQRMSIFFEIYIFTASTQDYADSIVAHLNSKKTTIRGVLSRNHCLQTHHGLRIKDLRIIKNRQLSNIVIVDNLVHSFGLQIDNGIPILDFTNNKKDRQLLGLEKMLMEIKDVQDVREYLRYRLGLRKVLEISEEEFSGIRRRKGSQKA